MFFHVTWPCKLTTPKSKDVILYVPGSFFENHRSRNSDHKLPVAGDESKVSIFYAASTTIKRRVRRDVITFPRWRMKNDLITFSRIHRVLAEHNIPKYIQRYVIARIDWAEACVLFRYLKLNGVVIGNNMKSLTPNDNRRIAEYRKPQN